MQTIPDDLLDRIVADKPDYAPLVARIREQPERAAEYERTLAYNYLGGTMPATISAREVSYLSAASAGHPYGRYIDLDYASHLSGYSKQHLRLLAGNGAVPAVKRKGEWYVDRDALGERERIKEGRPRRPAD